MVSQSRMFDHISRSAWLGSLPARRFGMLCQWNAKSSAATTSRFGPTECNVQTELSVLLAQSHQFLHFHSQSLHNPLGCTIQLASQPAMDMCEGGCRCRCKQNLRHSSCTDLVTYSTESHDLCNPESQSLCPGTKRKAAKVA